MPDFIVFQLTASQGGWPLLLCRFCQHSHFNSQPHKEADYAGFEEVFRAVYFNSQPHKEADADSEETRMVVGYFNSQPHKEADLIDASSWRTLEISTHSLTRRLTKYLKSITKIANISTHSLTRRLTIFSRNIINNKVISTHSLTRRLTVICILYQEYRIFQLTASQGGWLQRGFDNQAVMNISTHSLTRRLTMDEETQKTRKKLFQLTASQGGWR